MTQERKVSFGECVEEAKTEVDIVYDRKNWKEIIANIELIQDDLRGVGPTGKIFEMYTANELSAFSGRLAVYRASLLEYKMECIRQLDVAENFIKARKPSLREMARDELKKSSELKGDKKQPTVDEINDLIDRKLVKNFMIRDFHKKELERIQCYRYSIPSILFSIDLRIKVLMGDRDTTKFQSNDFVGEFVEKYDDNTDIAIN